VQRPLFFEANNLKLINNFNNQPLINLLKWVYAIFNIKPLKSLMYLYQSFFLRSYSQKKSGIYDFIKNNWSKNVNKFRSLRRLKFDNK